jgi:molecular chaperone DnaK
MVADAKRYSEEDKNRRHYVELKNELDSLAYQAHKFMAEKGGSLPAHISGRLTAALDAVKQIAEDNIDMTKLHQLKSELEQAYSQASQCQPDDAGQNHSNNSTKQTNQADDIIDAEYE